MSSSDKQPVAAAPATKEFSSQAERDEHFMNLAFSLASKSYSEGGCPIGGVLVDATTHTILGKGHNMLVQEGNPIIHGEMAALRDAGRIVSRRNTVMYTTLAPCMMCSGTIVQFKVGRVVVGDVTNAAGHIDFLRNAGVRVDVQEHAGCVELCKKFIKEKPELWLEDWGGN